MAQAGTYNPKVIQEVDLVVRVSGIVRETQKIEWGGDTTGGLPAQVVSTGTGMRSRTGSITWALREPVQGDPFHPLRRPGNWPPQEGEEVTVDATVDGQTFRRFTGRLGRTTGSLTDGSLTSEITDTLAGLLGGQVTVDPRLTGPRGRSYRAAWEAIEQSNLGLLPPPSGPGDVVLHSVLQGDSWSTIGGPVSVSGATEYADPYGLRIWSDLTTPTTTTGRSGRSILVVARGSSNWDSEVSARLADGTVFTLRHTHSSGALTLLVGGNVVREATWEGEGVPILAFGISFGFVYLWSAPDYRLTTETASYNSRVTEVWGTLIAATHVRYGLNSDFDAIVASTPLYPASMVRSNVLTTRTPATRGFENVEASTVLDSWGTATLSSTWMDEFGRIQIVARDRLLARPSSRTVRLDERLLGGSWSVGHDSVYQSVVVVGEQGAIRTSPAGQHRITIFKETAARGFDQPTVVEQFIEADSEIDWGPIDLTLSRAGTASLGGELDGSWVGMVVTDRDEGFDYERWAQIDGVFYTVSIERLGQRTLKTIETIDNIPSGETVYTKIAEVGTNMHRAVRGQPTPYYRAEWVSTWARYTRKANGGPVWAGTLELDAAWWLTPGDAQILANAVAAEVTQPMPTFSGTSMLWDPTRQIGDVETWIAKDGEGQDTWEAKVLIVGYDEEWTSGVPTQSVDSRVISMTDPRAGKTYLDLSQAYFTYSNISASQGTYSQIANALPNAF